MYRVSARRVIPTALPVVACVGVATGVALAAVKDAGMVRGVAGALFAALLALLYFAQRPGQEWARDVRGRSTWENYVAGAIGLRLLAGLVHLFAAFYLFNQMVDFIGFQAWVEDAGIAVLHGSLPPMTEGIDMLGSGSIALLLVPFYLFLGSSIAGMLLISAVIGFVASYVFLRSFQVAGIPGGDVPFIAKIFFFLPCFVFWGSLFGKDSLVYLCLAGVSYCVARLLHGARLRYALGLLIFVATTSVIRPHMGAPLCAALGVAWLLSRGHLSGPARVLVPARVLLRVMAMIVLVSIPVYLVVSLNRYVSIETLYKDMARRHYVLSSATADETGGLGSSLPPRLTGDSMWEFIPYLPEGFATFVFRPLPFDAHNAQALVASMEGTLLVVIVVWRWRRLVRALRLAWSNSYLMFCAATFFLSTTTLCFERNLGLIARHRIMVLPFLMLMLAVPLKKEPAVEDPARHFDDHDLALEEGRSGAP